MSKTVTLRLSDDVYQRFRQSAENDNCPLSNFIETATLRFIEQSELDAYGHLFPGQVADAIKKLPEMLNG